MNRRRLVTVAAIALAVALVAGAAFLVRQVFFGPTTITAYFPTATSIYPGDEVRVSGVKVGKIDSITPEGLQSAVRRYFPSRRHTEVILMPESAVKQGDAAVPPPARRE